MSRSRNLLVAAGTVVVIAGGLLTVGALGGSPTSKPEQPTNQAAPAPANSLLKAITTAQVTLKNNPKDFAAWAGLSLAYVQQAKVGGDTSLYTRAEGAAQRSLSLNKATNYLGYAALAAVKNGRHDFAGALVAARQGLTVNSYNSTLYGAEGDALTQLGRYADATKAIDRMNQLLPGVPAFTRASYALELRGDVTGSRAALQRARDDSTNPADIAFCEYYLAELDLHYGGGAQSALVHYQAGLEQTPEDAGLRAGRAKAEAALGMYDAAVADYRSSVQARPIPQTVLELGQLLQAHGDQAGADEQYALFRVEEKLYGQSGVALDTEATLFEADHGSPAKAVANAKLGWKNRPFVEMADAYAWALHAAKDDAGALGWANRAFASGWKTAPALYHRGMIQLALGNKAAAKSDLTESLRLDPAFDALGAPRAKAALSRL
jgi:tetratricopeptide (TPR) repeat protein